MKHSGSASKNNMRRKNAPCKTAHRRAGVAPMEAVMVMTLIVPATVTVMVITSELCQLVHGIINTTVTWPYL